MTFQGGGFAKNAPLALEFQSTPTPLGNTTADASGNFKATVTIPNDATGGAHHLVARGPGANGGPPGGPGSESLFPGEPTDGRGSGTKGKGRGSGLGAGGLTSGPGQPRAGSGKGTATTFFIKDQGNSFVFCIDRSASMSQSGRLAAAKSELLNALKNLDKTNQFQIIFYNDKMDIFRPLGKSFVTTVLAVASGFQMRIQRRM